MVEAKGDPSPLQDKNARRAWPAFLSSSLPPVGPGLLAIPGQWVRGRRGSPGSDPLDKTAILAQLEKEDKEREPDDYHDHLNNTVDTKKITQLKITNYKYNTIGRQMKCFFDGKLSTFMSYAHSLPAELTLHFNSLKCSPRYLFF